jgi:hypothetical protein
MKKLLPLLLLSALLLTACAGPGESASDADHTVITFNGADVEIRGGGAEDKGSAVVISAAGTYEVTGVSSEKTLVVDTGDDAMDVTLILNNVEITGATDPAIHVKQAKHFRLQLAEGSQNRLNAGTEELLKELDPNATGAALYSADDMDIEGKGSLTVCGYRNNGIGCKKDLDINSGTITVVAANNGVKGNNSVQIKGGTLNVTSWGDGIKATTEDKEGKGYVEISGGTVTVEAWGDGVQAATELRVTGGTLSVVTRGDGQNGSSKALKAQGDVLLSGGKVSLETLTDGLRSEYGSVSCTGGSLLILAGGDGIQAGVKDSGTGDVSITGGSVSISASNQAVKARGAFTVTGGGLTAFCGSEKQAAPGGSAAWLLCAISGSAGDSVKIGDSVLTPQKDYKCVLLTGGPLRSGETVQVSNGTESLEVPVN